MTVEVWKPVVGFEGLYEVSNLGRVRRGSRILKAGTNSRGYLRVMLQKGRLKASCYVHLLVAKHFIGPCPPGHEVNHLSGIKTDCSATNLEYLTRTENIRHAFRTGLYPIGSERPAAKLDEIKVREIKLLEGKMMGKDIAVRYGVSPSTITLIFTGKIWKHVA